MFKSLMQSHLRTVNMNIRFRIWTECLLHSRSSDIKYVECLGLQQFTHIYSGSFKVNNDNCVIRVDIPLPAAKTAINPS